MQNYSRTPAGEAVGFRISSSHYYVSDLLGSVIGMFSGTGIWEGGYSYSPYGEERATSTNNAVALNSLRYIGGYQESLNLYKLGARYYDASTGRFTQADPTGQESNAYSYAGCNPVNSSDPTGQEGGTDPVTCNGPGVIASGVFVFAGALGGLTAGGSIILGLGILAVTTYVSLSYC